MQSMGELLTLCDVGPVWVSHLVVALAMTWTFTVAGMVLVRIGRSPLWALLIFVPYAGALGLWLIARTRWPRLEPVRG